MTIRTSETIINLSKALVETQKELKQPLKDAKNPFFKSEYVPLEKRGGSYHGKCYKTWIGVFTICNNNRNGECISRNNRFS